MQKSTIPSPNGERNIEEIRAARAALFASAAQGFNDMKPRNEFGRRDPCMVFNAAFVGSKTVTLKNPTSFITTMKFVTLLPAYPTDEEAAELSPANVIHNAGFYDVVNECYVLHGFPKREKNQKGPLPMSSEPVARIYPLRPVALSCRSDSPNDDGTLRICKIGGVSALIGAKVFTGCESVRLNTPVWSDPTSRRRISQAVMYDALIAAPDDVRMVPNPRECRECGQIGLFLCYDPRTVGLQMPLSGDTRPRGAVQLLSVALIDRLSGNADKDWMAFKLFGYVQQWSDVEDNSALRGMAAGRPFCEQLYIDAKVVSRCLPGMFGIVDEVIWKSTVFQYVCATPMVLCGEVDEVATANADINKGRSGVDAGGLSAWVHQIFHKARDTIRYVTTPVTVEYVAGLTDRQLYLPEDSGRRLASLHFVDPDKSIVLYNAMNGSGRKTDKLKEKVRAGEGGFRVMVAYAYPIPLKDVVSETFRNMTPEQGVAFIKNDKRVDSNTFHVVYYVRHRTPAQEAEKAQRHLSEVEEVKRKLGISRPPRVLPAVLAAPQVQGVGEGVAFPAPGADPSDGSDSDTRMGFTCGEQRLGVTHPTMSSKKRRKL